jgi:AcrR family transcriptional regulator
MPRPAVHDADAVLDAARALVLDGGPRAASVANIAKASGAPVGSLYHRFGSRDELLAAAWLRAVAAFHERYAAAAAEHPDDPVAAGAAMAASVVRFARERPDDARLLAALRLGDLLDGDAPAALEQANAPSQRALLDVARRLGGRSLSRVRLACVDLPYGAVRGRLDEGALPPSLDDDVRAAAEAILRAEETTT